MVIQTVIRATLRAFLKSYSDKCDKSLWMLLSNIKKRLGVKLASVLCLRLQCALIFSV